MKNISLFAFTLLIYIMSFHQSSAQCTMICYDARQINASSSCATPIDFNTVLVEAIGNCSGLTLEIFDEFDQLVPNPIPGAYNGQPLYAKVTDATTGNFCICNIVLRDIEPPVLTRSESWTSIDCNTTLNDIRPIVTECSPYILEHSIDEYCDPVKGLMRTYQWSVEDIFGNTDDLLVSYEMEFLPEHLLFPGTFFISCDDPLATACSGTPCPDVSGDLQIATDNCIDLVYGFEDVVYPVCGGAFDVVRTWSVHDPCNLVAVHQQIIKIRDFDPPTITAPNLPAKIGFNRWRNNNIPMATAIDECGAVDLITFEDSYVPNCHVLDITRTWMAYDECFNYSTASESFQVDYQFKSRIPNIQNISCGDPVTISVLVRGGIPGFTYQWTQTGNWTIISGTNQSSIEVIPNGGKSVFKVKVTDDTGCITRSKRKFKCKNNTKQGRPLIEEEMDDAIAIYNSGNEVNVQWESEKEVTVQFEIWNILGQSILNTERIAYKGVNKDRLLLPQSNPGIYILVIQTEDKTVVQKFILN